MNPAELSGSESDEGEQGERAEGAAAGEPVRVRRLGQRIGLHDFLQLIVRAGGQEMHRAAANSNDELIQNLWRAGTLRSPAVKRAMLVCRRDLFMPEGYAEEAFVDAPVHVEEHGFNISAPHIHATALEALELQEGDMFLDVGCGCGLLSAAAAQLVGRKGRVAAMDIRQCCLDMSRRAVARLRDEDPDYAESSCEIEWDLHNVFIPTSRHTGKYSKVYVGAACPRERLRDVVKLLSPQGGLLLAPVDSELLLLKKSPTGKLGQRTLSAVRFSELEVPRDAEVVLACMKEEMEKARQINVPASTFESDMATMTAAGVGSPSKLAETEAPSQRQMLEPWAPSTQNDTAQQVEQQAAGLQQEDTRPTERAGTPKRHKSDAGLIRQPSYLQELPDPLSQLGPPDCYLHGMDEPDSNQWQDDMSVSTNQPQPAEFADGAAQSTASGEDGAAAGGKPWRLPAHRAVLQARCEHFRARFLSGMRDAQEGALAAPDGVSSIAVRALLHYVYQDRGVQDLNLPLERVTEVLHVAAFYGCPRLISLCEQRLAAVLTTPEEGAEEAAAQLLALAEEVGGLDQLRTLALSYVIEHYAAVSRSESYKRLPRPVVDLITAHACAHANRMLTSLRGLASYKASTSSTAATAQGGSDDGDGDGSDMSL